jgi:uncharacterized membrane protein YhaH (DUF805 family)
MFELFSFWGRIGRARYWGLSGLCLLTLIGSSIAVALTANATNATPVNVPAAVVAIAGFFLCWAMLMALVGLGVRRLHDRGRSGFWIVPYYAVYPPVAFILFDGDWFGPLGTALFCLAASVMLWSIIDLGFLKGKAAADQDRTVAEAA